MASGPLAGIRILDLTQIIAGPLGCMLLADLGAEVIKVEPLGGEPWRVNTQFIPLESKSFHSLNRGKQSVALDLSRAECREVVHRLVRICDVVVINYRPDVAVRLSVDYETLCREREDLIYVDSTAFGRKGPWAHRPGYDIVAQAASGLLTYRGHLDERGAPALSGSPAPALFHRERTGQGQLVETSLLANALMIQASAFMDLPAADAERRGSFLKDLRASRASHEPFDQFVRRRRQRGEHVVGGGIYYRGYLTKDGALTVGCLSASTREKFRQALGIDDRTDQSHRDADPAEFHRAIAELVAMVEAMLKERSTDEWMEIFDRNGVPASPVHFVEELLDNPQVVENGYAVELEHDLSGPETMAAPPLKMSASPAATGGAAPPLGRDTRKVLASAGYSAEEIEALTATGTIGVL